MRLTPMDSWPVDRVVANTQATARGVAKVRPLLTYAGPTNETYREHVSDHDQEPNAWAEFLRQIAKDREWSINRLAKESGVHRSTFFRWLKGESEPDLPSVRLVAETLGVDMPSALRAAGQLAADAAVDEDDYEIRMIKESGLRPQLREHLIAEVLARRERDRAHRRDELARQIEFYRGDSRT